MATEDRTPAPELTDAEVDALHEVELGVEWLRRAHGKLVEFHHNTGHAMEHLAAAEEELRAAGHEDVADEIRDRYLPRGVIDDDRWSYDVLESFEADFLADLTAFEERARSEVADGRRHVAERRQEREWKRRAQDRSESE
jgi:prophage tail gpP-like protein